jgi:hypothetical protein
VGEFGESSLLEIGNEILNLSPDAACIIFATAALAVGNHRHQRAST